MNIVWFRSDLRTEDNPALYKGSEDLATMVRAIFFVTPGQWLAHKLGPNKIGFLLNTVLQLQKDLEEQNINLDILYCESFKQIPEVLLQYANKYKAKNIFFNKEYELNETVRDRHVEEMCNSSGIKCHSFHDQCLLPPGSITNKQDAPYSIFTAFKKAYYQNLNAHVLQQTWPRPKRRTVSNFTSVKQELPSEIKNYLKNDILDSYGAGEANAHKVLVEFCEHKLENYKLARDFPALDATSKLSAYLAVGAISVRTCSLYALHENDMIFPGGNPNVMCWLDELIWRDFYRHVIFHNPDICKGENYSSQYNKIKWSKSKAAYAAWTEGKTGIPIIDAAMRQLVQTGWMHNRLRMIVAMFLTKQLLIDWRRGEDFFSQHLIDLDFASNNGGWQWCASTGTDAVPYFRIFNPITQSIRFDPDGDFIRKFCPELKNLDNKRIHNPSALCDNATFLKLNYPKLMIDLKSARQGALAAFKGSR